MKRKHNAKSNHRFIAAVCRYGALAILALFAITAIPAMAHNPELMHACGLIMPIGAGMRFFEADKDGGGGDDTFRSTVLKGVEKLQADSEALAKRIEAAEKAGTDLATLKSEFDKLAEDTRKLRQANLAVAAKGATRKGEVSEECARYLGGLAVVAGLKGGQLAGDRYDGMVKDILGVEPKTALSSSDIPLPVQYNAQVVELVSAHGAARRFGTVFPLGAATVKLPKLTTDPAFGLIAQSGTVTEKSPQIGWVTFNPEKFGGLVRLPSELDEDSIIAIGQFVARYSARQIALVEDTNFFIGTGAGSGANGSVKGLCLSTIDNSKVVQMASTKTKYSDTTLAHLRSIRATVDAPVIGMGAYYMHPSFEQHLSGLNTAGDKPYQANGSRGATLDGYAINWVDTMPAYSTSANVSKVFVLFGDLSYQYLATRGGVRMDTSKEAGFTTDEILIRALERFTIGLMANGAVSGLETAAS